MSLLEVLISAGLLLVISAILFQILVPTMGRSMKLDEKQENLQRGVVLRHHLNMRLKLAQFTAIEPTRLEFYVPDQVSTPYGFLNKVGTDEMVAYDQTKRLEIASEARADGTWVVERIVGQPGTTRGIWNLGPGGTLSFTSTPPMVNVRVTGTAGRLETGSWTRQFDLVLPNADTGGP
ncbi:MAG: hypothetical protein AB1758_15515 [Candidatus Eremiobacterota bacterium]